MHDVLAYFELCELDAEGAYSPVPVKREGRSLLEPGVFSLAQGVQRRVRVKLVHPRSANISWKRVLDMTVGNVRESQDPASGGPGHPPVSLNFLPSEMRHVVRGEAASLSLEAGWDSSRHESLFLNRVTPSKQAREQCCFCDPTAYSMFNNSCLTVCCCTASLMLRLLCSVYGLPWPSPLSWLTATSQPRSAKTSACACFAIGSRTACSPGASPLLPPLLSAALSAAYSAVHGMAWRSRG